MINSRERRAEGYEEICHLVVGRGLGGGICGNELRFAPFDFEHGGSQPAGGAYAFGGSHAGPGGVNVFVRCSSLDGAVGDDDRCASVCNTIRSLLSIGGEEKQVEGSIENISQLMSNPVGRHIINNDSAI